MALSLGPRLGITTSPESSFKVWAKFSGSATIELQTRVNGTTDWVSQDTQAVDTSRSNTVVLTASGLNPKTLYDYRLLEDSSEVFSEVTMTLPTNGRFIAYHLSDFHESDASATFSAWALSDWETNYKASNIPAVVTYLGDLWLLTSEGLPATFASCALQLETEMVKHCGSGLCFSRIPMAYMFDDWDFGGNNSAVENCGSFSAEVDPYQAALNLQDHYWRDRPQPASPSFGFSFEIANVPFIFGDNRSQRTPQSSENPTLEKSGDRKIGTLYGSAQQAWLTEQFKSYGQRGLVLYFHGDQWRDQVGASVSGIGGVRDSTGIFYQHERNEIIKDGMVGYGYVTNNNLLVVSSDNHYNAMFAGYAGDPTHWSTATSYPGANSLIPFREVNARSHNQPALIFARSTSGFGDYFDNKGPNTPAVLVFDLNSSHLGKVVTLRLTWRKATDGSILESDTGPSTGAVGDFYYSRGVWSAYTAPGQADRSGSGEQVYPPRNGPRSGIRFLRSYTDDITGELVYENEMAYDDEDRLRKKSDIGDVDRDTLMEDFIYPEEPDEEPLK